ncbi:transcription initiation factor IIA large subunit-like isoform X2 [Tasmannia lanceolata]|uniref:transcription initiation factor IIA large subunit-like isoform X2 n=1 Tax=Tasmannia lanceolata TaxID=3420 RepID=UPI004063E425
MAASVSDVYIHVIEDVINKVRDDFLNSGVGDNVLTELQGLWELKMMHCEAICGPIERTSLPKAIGPPITPVHDLNLPYEGPEVYETPTAEMLFPPTPSQTPIQTPLPGTVDQSLYHLPTGPGDFASMHDTRGSIDMTPGRPSPYMQPPSPWMHQRPLGVDVNVAYVEGRDEADRGAPHQPTTQDFLMISSGKRKREDYASHFQSGGYIPQQDGAVDPLLENFQLEASQGKNSANRSDGVNENSEMRLSVQVISTSKIPQQDGIHDGFEDLFRSPEVGNEGYNTPSDQDLHAVHAIGTPLNAVGTPKPAKSESVEDDEPPLNEDDDDDLDDLEQEEEEPNTQHLVLAQFDKVTRTKSRWKCMLKDGIMHINRKDILFNKATGEFEF